MGWIKGSINKKGRALARLCAIFIMGTAAIAAYAGCAGDCMTCHPNLEGSQEHMALKNCISCHTPSKEQIFEFGGGSAEECGNDCFECHQQWPADGNHAPLDTCQNCHQKSEDK